MGISGDPCGCGKEGMVCGERGGAKIVWSIRNDPETRREKVNKGVVMKRFAIGREFSVNLLLLVEKILRSGYLSAWGADVNGSREAIEGWLIERGPYLWFFQWQKSGDAIGE